MRARLKDLPGHWVEILGATVFWCLLWGQAHVVDVLGGLLAACLVVLAFPLPRASRELTIRILPVLSLLVHVAGDMVVSSAQVAWYALRPGPAPLCSVVAVRLASRSDLFLTATAMLATLIPGSVVVEAQRSTGTLFLHVIGAEGPDDVEHARQRTLALEERLLRAFARRAIRQEAGAS